jgi:hypothetical protein
MVDLREFTQRYFEESFGGGMIPFDDVYWKALDSGHSPAEAQRAGVHAVVEKIVTMYEQAERDDLNDRIDKW